ncbi:hypothetical protein INR49_003736 [Caranx melampygus]|nr:hypothetical protein INR49_003736 [Caranx melampygus]
MSLQGELSSPDEFRTVLNWQNGYNLGAKATSYRCQAENYSTGTNRTSSQLQRNIPLAPREEPPSETNAASLQGLDDCTILTCSGTTGQPKCERLCYTSPKDSLQPEWIYRHDLLNQTHCCPCTHTHPQ